MLSLMVLKLFKTDKVQARSFRYMSCLAIQNKQYFINGYYDCFRSMSCLAIQNNQICYYQFDDIDNT